MPNAFNQPSSPPPPPPFRKNPSTSIPPLQQIPQPIHIRARPHPFSPLHHLRLRTHPRQHRQRRPQPSLNSKPNIRVHPITHHARLRPLKLEFPLNRIHHRRARFTQRQRLPPQHFDQRRGYAASAGEQGPRGREGGVCVRGEEDGLIGPGDVVIGEREFEVGDVEVEADEDDADGGVEQRRVVGGDGGVVLRCDVSAVFGICAAEVVEPFALQLGFDAGLAEDEDFAFFGWERQDARDVDGGAVGGVEDFFGRCGDAHVVELLLVVGPGFGRVVGYEDEAFVQGVAEVGQRFDDVREEVGARPEDAWE